MTKVKRMSLGNKLGLGVLGSIAVFLVFGVVYTKHRVSKICEAAVAGQPTESFLHWARENGYGRYGYDEKSGEYFFLFFGLKPGGASTCYVKTEDGRIISSRIKD